MNLITKDNTSKVYFVAAEKGKIVFHPDKMQAFHTSDRLAAVFLCNTISMHINKNVSIEEPIKGMFSLSLNPNL
jgi:hypothetical protein